MKRRHFLGSVTSGMLVGAIGSTRDLVAAIPQTGSPVRTPLVLMAPRVDGIDAIWAVNRLCTGRAEWEAADGGKSGAVTTDPFGFVPQGENVLRARIAGLAPGASYRIRSVTRPADGTGEVASAWKEFRTLSADAPSTAFVIWNDTHIRNETIQRLHEVTPAADFLVWNGDTCNDWTTSDLLVPTLLHPGECDITAGRPLLLTFGNHDVRGPRAFEVPDVVTTPSDRPFYAFRSGPVAVICLHTGEDKPDSHPSFGGRVSFDVLRREQADWLAGVIGQPAFRDAPYRVVFCHIPLRWIDESPQAYDQKGFDRHSGRSRAAWHDSLVAWNTQLIISGHTHQHAWLPPTAAWPYGQLIGGGPALEAATWIGAKADAQQLTIEMRNLGGTVLETLSFPPLRPINQTGA